MKTLRKPTSSNSTARLLFVPCLIFTVLLGVSAHAATITWGTATTISGDSDVSTSGTLDEAFNFVRPDTSTGPDGPATVNGVTFNTFGPFNQPSITIGNATLSASGGSGGVESYNGFAGTTPPFTNLSANYQQLLQTGAYNNAGSLTLSLAGLTQGWLYQVELFANDSRSGGTARTETVTAGNSISLAYDASLQPGGLGDFVTGTFTADSATESINFTAGTPDQSTGIAASQINGFELRTESVPEPSTWAGLLTAIGSVFIAFRKRQRIA